MNDEYDDTQRVSTHDDDTGREDFSQGIGADDTEVAGPEEVDAFDRTEIAPGSFADQYDDTAIASPDSVIQRPHLDASLEATDRASGSILRKSPGKATLDFGHEEESEAYGLDEESFSETSVAPITADDLDATAVGEAIDGRFRLLGVLGEGGMGRVYRGIQLSINRDVAIKVVLEEFAQDAELRQRFLREAQLISGFTHPNIVRLVDFGETEGRLYLAMEFVNGKPLTDLFRGKAVKPRFALDMMRQVTSALIEAHESGVVHRDLKPDNILLTRIADGSAQCKVLDFGVARTSTSDLTAAGTVCGTPDYMAPEQARGQTVAGPTDLYSVGAMLFELLTGRLPFQASSPVKMMIMQVNEDAPRVREFMPNVPEEIDELVHSLLKKSANERVSPASYLCEKFESIMDDYGWSSAVRLPVGPLAETTREWLASPNDPKPRKRSESMMGEQHSPARAGGAQNEVEVPGEDEALQGNDWLMGTSLGDDGDHNQNEFSPDRSFSLDTAQPSDNAAPPPQKPQAADPEPPGAGFENIELDRPDPRNTPVPQPASTPPPGQLQSQRSVNTPVPQQSPMAQRNTPAPGASASRSQTSPRHQPQGDDPTNKILIAVLVVLMVASGAVAYWLFVIKNDDAAASGEEVAAENSTVATGEAKRVFDQLEARGWERAGPISTQSIGEIVSTSSKLKQGTKSLLVDVYTCPTVEDVRTIFKQRAYPPRKGYHYGDTVIVLEAGPDTAPAYTQIGLDILKEMQPDGIDSITQL